jgi:sucrose phosphorylase
MRSAGAGDDVRPLVQLITYADRLAGDLAGLATLLDGRLAGVFGGVHVLPFFHRIDGEDAGFDPIDHRRVDASIGTWDDIARLGEGRSVCADLIVNHASAASPWFVDVVENGSASPFCDMFLTFDKVFPDGATEAELMRIYRPRPGLPFSVKAVGGRNRLMWTTFAPGQVDLDVDHAVTRRALCEVMDVMSANGVTCLRLDAVGYAVKRAGTSCFMTGETTAYIRELTAAAHERALEVLVEVHAHHQHQIDIAREVDLVYDFALPPLVLHALNTGDVEPLLRWLAERPANAVTVLDTHDGIGLIDVAADPVDGRPGLLDADQLLALREAIHGASKGVSRRASGQGANNLDAYQVNCTWFDAVGRDDARMCLSRLIQLLVPGIPQVYYVGLLAGENDEELLDGTGVGRDVNRHRYTDVEIDDALQRPVVAAVIAAIRLRNRHPAFDGTFSCGRGLDPRSLRLAWQHGNDRIALHAVPRTGAFRMTWTGAQGVRTVSTVAELASMT